MRLGVLRVGPATKSSAKSKSHLRRTCNCSEDKSSNLLTRLVREHANKMRYLTAVAAISCCSTSVAFLPCQTSSASCISIGGANCNGSIVALHAKKKKGGKKGAKSKNKSKQSGMEWATNFKLKPFEATATRDLASMAAASFEGRCGKPLSEELRGSSDIPKALWSAPVAVVVVGEPDNADGKNAGMTCKYANVAALETVGLKPDQYERVIAPSGPGSEEAKVVEDAIILNLPTEMKGDKKYESGYKKKILRSSSPSAKNNDDEETDEEDTSDSSKDTSITIMDAHRWSLEKSALIDGKFVTTTVGVAYAWESWAVGDETLCSAGGITKPLLKPSELEDAVAKQAAAIRELKEGRGLGNKDPEVVEAVSELLRLKDLLESVA